MGNTGAGREEAADAMALMLHEDATLRDRSILIAHRVRRPEPQELAGMLDTYRKLGPVLKSPKNAIAPICFRMPFDRQTRTAPIYHSGARALGCPSTRGAPGRRQDADQVWGDNP